jgi:hypothetical protein
MPLPTLQPLHTVHPPRVTNASSLVRPTWHSTTEEILQSARFHTSTWHVHAASHVGHRYYRLPRLTAATRLTHNRLTLAQSFGIFLCGTTVRACSRLTSLAGMYGSCRKCSELDLSSRTIRDGMLVLRIADVRKSHQGGELLRSDVYAISTLFEVHRGVEIACGFLDLEPMLRDWRR